MKLPDSQKHEWDQLQAIISKKKEDQEQCNGGKFHEHPTVFFRKTRPPTRALVTSVRSYYKNQPYKRYNRNDELDPYSPPMDVIFNQG